MNLSDLKPGDRIEARVNGLTFTARYIRTEDGYAWVEPTYRWANWHKLAPERVIRKLRP